MFKLVTFIQASNLKGSLKKEILKCVGFTSVHAVMSVCGLFELPKFALKEEYLNNVMWHFCILLVPLIWYLFYMLYINCFIGRGPKSVIGFFTRNF